MWWPSINPGASIWDTERPTSLHCILPTRWCALESTCAIMLDMNFSCCPGGTLPRSELELGRLLDMWSGFGLPLLVGISVPSGDGADPKARHNASTAGANAPETWTRAVQQSWAARHVPLLLAKPSVQGIFWNQFEDALPHDFPHAGLVTPQGHAKPALRTLANLRRR